MLQRSSVWLIPCLVTINKSRCEPVHSVSPSEIPTTLASQTNVIMGSKKIDIILIAGLGEAVINSSDHRFWPRSFVNILLRCH